MILPVIQYPAPLLRLRSKEVTDEEIKSETFLELVLNLEQTLTASRGAAISAVQCGQPVRVIVVNPELADDNPTVLINPVLVTQAQETQAMREGCLSMKDILANVHRAPACVVRAQGLDGESVTVYAQGNLAQALQHELEHLDGVLLVDKVGPVKREMIKRRMRGRKGNAILYATQR